MRPDDFSQDALTTLTQHIAQFAPAHDRDGSFPHQAFAEFAKRGLIANPPVGPGQFIQLLHLLTAIGEGDLSAGRIFEGHVNSVWLIESFGSLGTRAMARDNLDNGAIFGVWNTDAPGTPLKLVDAKLVGKKNFASGVDGLTHAIVTVPQPDGRLMILVPLEDLPIDRSWWNPVGMRASGSHVVDFTGVPVAAPFVIGKADNYITQPWFSAGAIRFLAVQTGGIKAIFSIALDHLRKTGRADNPYQAHRLARMAASVQTCLLWLDYCAQVWTRAEAAPSEAANAELMAAANAARGVIETQGLAVLTEAEQAIGAAGMIAPHRFERVMRDLRTYLRQPNPDGAAMAFGTAVSAGQWSPSGQANPK